MRDARMRGLTIADYETLFNAYATFIVEHANAHCKILILPDYYGMHCLASYRVQLHEDENVELMLWPRQKTQRRISKRTN